MHFRRINEMSIRLVTEKYILNTGFYIEIYRSSEISLNIH